MQRYACTYNIRMHSFSIIFFLHVVLESELTNVKDCLQKTESQLHSKVLELKSIVEKVSVACTAGADPEFGKRGGTLLKNS